MNKQPIEAAHDQDLRLSVIAMRRAALRARELAQQTRTAVVISCQGVIQRLEVTATVSEQTLCVQKPLIPYDRTS